MPEAAKNYSITELEMCGLAMNIATFSHLLKKVNFDAVVDHLAITHIMRSKAEPAMTRIKRLLELLSPYSFNLYYIKGKDMVLSDFLSRQKTDDSNPHELIPISFMLRNQVDNHFFQINSRTDHPKTDKYLVQTRSQAKSSSIKIPEIHGANKGLDPHVQPGKQRPLPSLPIHSIDKGPPTHPIPKPRIGQGRAGLRRKVKTHQPISLLQQTSAQPMVSQVPKAALPLATFTHNTCNSPNLANHSPYKLVFGRKPKLLMDLETDPDVRVSGTYREYFLQLRKRLGYLHKLLQDFWIKRLALINKDREDFQYNSRDLVYIISPLKSQLRTVSRKVSIKYVGPLTVYKIVDPHNYLLITLDGKLLRGLLEHERLKPAVIRTNQGNVTNLSKLKQVMSSGLLLP